MNTLDEHVLLQSPQGLAYRRAADAQFFGQCGLHQGRAGREIAVKDMRAERFID